MKIVIANKRFLPDALTVWHELLPGVDVQMDQKNLTFAKNWADEILAVHVLEHLFENEVQGALKNWYDVLKPGGKLFLVVNDFEYLSRMIVGGEINIRTFNASFSTPMQYDRDLLVELARKTGFKEENALVWWMADVPDKYKKSDFELILQCEKL